MVTKLRYKEVQGKVIEEGTMTVTHGFDTTTELIQYIRRHWADLDNAEELEEIEFDLDVDGDFILTIEEVIEDEEEF